MGEGAGVVVLGEYEHAKARGARIYAEVAGYGMSGDAYHIAAPAEGHDGACRSMRAAMRNGGFTPHDIQYVNAHGTSTPLDDDLELEAVERLFGDAAHSLAMGMSSEWGFMPRWLTACFGWRVVERDVPTLSRTFHCRLRSGPGGGGRHLFGTSASAATCSFAD